MSMSGRQLLDKAINIQKAKNSHVAASLLEKHGIPYELGLIALVGARRATLYYAVPASYFAEYNKQWHNKQKS